MSDLRRRLNAEFDPTDADRAMSVAWQGLLLLEICERILFAERHGMRVGRDDSSRLSVQMMTLGHKLGLVNVHDSTSIADFHAALAPELVEKQESK